VKNKNRTKTIIKLKIIHKRAIVEEREKIKTKKNRVWIFHTGDPDFRAF